nr:ATP synthase F0 subunit 6 [Aphidius gifuensis]QZX44070.1 ATP synthase F0 subunit 6 [Aphidius gifuensis]QZX44071.1 ATP synthase F0 subunit 6 [Aphidius gifuensis]QZX44073.1 ATP synthase F0 subunit 6 [Aphidius gifuensis]WLE65461.1 ATP synthase F0 subunit 6 [Aphidius gifuensis]
MLNLFSIFDPSTKIFSLNWISSLIGLFFIPQMYWFMSSRILFLMINFMLILWMEFKIILKNKFNMNNLLFYISLFLFIMMNNFMGLFPYIFTSSSHLIYSLGLSLPMWLGLMMFGWIKNTNFMFAHLVPQGTPFILMFFMVLIESLSNIIRPFTLSIRLTANMIAGHLLLTLLSSFIPNFFLFYLIVLILQLMLLILEVSVSLIQSYVFVILMILYLKETNYDKI